MKIQSYKDLIVWQKSFRLVIAVYKLTSQFPKSEMFGLVSQMRRAAVSVCSNIAEGYQRKSTGDLARFLRIALGSASELETQMMLAEKLGLTPAENFVPARGLLVESLKLINCFLNKINLTT